MLGYTINENTVTCVIKGKIYTINRDHPQVSRLIMLLKEQRSEEEIIMMFDRIRSMQHYMDGTVEVSGNKVYFKGREIHNTIARRILQFMSQDLPYEPLIEFLKRLYKNISNRAIQELYGFLEHEGLPLTPYGTFLAYKGVDYDFYSLTGNKTTRVISGKTDDRYRIYNGIGEVISVDRQDVDDDCRRTCSHGLHVGAYTYAFRFGPKQILVEVDPVDVVSVPADCSGEKLRVCKYRVIDHCTGILNYDLADKDNPNQAYQVSDSVDEDEDCVEEIEDYVDDANPGNEDEDDDMETQAEDAWKSGFDAGMNTARQRLQT